MTKHLSFILAVFLCSQVFGLPRYSLRNGGQCVDCHVNPTGGQLRNAGGWTYGKNNLKMWNTYTEDEEAGISPKIGKNIYFGMDYRTQYIAQFSDGMSRSTFQKMSGSIYADAAIGEKLNIYARYDFAKGYYEGFGIANIIPNGYVKAGTFLPNFGLRIDDHSAYTRNGDYGMTTTSTMGLPYTPNYVETGIEIGYTINDVAFLTASSGVSNGSISFANDPSYTFNAMFFPINNDNVRLFLGASAAFMKVPAPGNTLKTNLTGGYAGFGFKNLTVLAEFDKANSLYLPDTAATVMMLEASYKIQNGLEAMIRYDSFNCDNPDATTFATFGKTYKRSHTILGLNWYPYSFVEVMPQYRIQTEDPEVKNNVFLVQLHFWY